MWWMTWYRISALWLVVRYVRFGTQSRNPYTSLSGKSAMNLLLLLLRPDPARLPPLPGTQALAIQTSQRLLHCTIFLASYLYYACSVTSFFSVRLFFKLVYGKRGSVQEA